MCCGHEHGVILWRWAQKFEVQRCTQDACITCVYVCLPLRRLNFTCESFMRYADELVLHAHAPLDAMTRRIGLDPAYIEVEKEVTFDPNKFRRIQSQKRRVFSRLL